MVKSKKGRQVVSVYAFHLPPLFSVAIPAVRNSQLDSPCCLLRFGRASQRAHCSRYNKCELEWYVCFTYILQSVNVRSLVCKLCHCVDLLIHVVCTYDFVSVIGMHARSVFFTNKQQTGSFICVGRYTQHQNFSRISRSNICHQQFYLPDVNIQVKNGHGILGRLVPCI